MKFLLYGAYGYSGRLIAEKAADFGLEPILAGRSEEKTKDLAQTLGLDYRVFDLEDSIKLQKALQEVKVRDRLLDELIQWQQTISAPIPKRRNE